MDIGSALRFVRGAVSTKTFVPEMTHFVIQEGRVRSFNGTLALSSPIDMDVDCNPKAVPLVQAIGNCGDVITLGMQSNGRLRIGSGAFRAFIDCIDGEMPHQQPDGETVNLDGAQLLRALKALSPFVGNDASRPWTNGILLRGQSAYATNNVCLAEFWLGGAVLPGSVNIPMAAIREIMRVGIPPESAQLSEHSITLHYEDGRWIRTQLYGTDWPPVERILDVLGAAPVPIPEGLFEGLAAIKPFTEKEQYVHFTEGGVATHSDPALGASYELTGSPSTGIYALPMLQLLEGVATSADFGFYPNPVPFYGDCVRGVILGRLP